MNLQIRLPMLVTRVLAHFEPDMMHDCNQGLQSSINIAVSADALIVGISHPVPARSEPSVCLRHKLPIFNATGHHSAALKQRSYVPGHCMCATNNHTISYQQAMFDT
eukprot:jgi/Ulvmu1/4464/UM002_0189.1